MHCRPVRGWIPERGGSPSALGSRRSGLSESPACDLWIFLETPACLYSLPRNSGMSPNDERRDRPERRERRKTDE